jgi:hypothetical protein
VLWLLFRDIMTYGNINSSERKFIASATVFWGVFLNAHCRLHFPDSKIMDQLSLHCSLSIRLKQKEGTLIELVDEPVHPDKGERKNPSND